MACSIFANYRALALGFAAVSLALPAMADPIAIARFKDWTVFQDSVDGDTVCFAATEATDKAPKAASHGDVWFYVTSWKSGKARNQPSLKVGYDLRAESLVLRSDERERLPLTPLLPEKHDCVLGEVPSGHPPPCRASAARRQAPMCCRVGAQTRKTAEPQVKPAPKTVERTRSPFLTFPS